jgi:hypothetical protein
VLATAVLLIALMLNITIDVVIILIIVISTTIIINWIITSLFSSSSLPSLVSPSFSRLSSFRPPSLVGKWRQERDSRNTWMVATTTTRTTTVTSTDHKCL